LRNDRTRGTGGQDVGVESVASSTQFRWISGAGHRTIGVVGDGGACIEVRSTVAFLTIFCSKVLVAIAERRTAFESHVIDVGVRFGGKSSATCSFGVALVRVVVADDFGSTRLRKLSWRAVRVDLKTVAFTASLTGIASAGLGTARIDSLRRVGSQVLTTEALRTIFYTSDRIAELIANSSAEFDGVARIGVSRIFESLDTAHIVGPTTLISHVASIHS